MRAQTRILVDVYCISHLIPLSGNHLLRTVGSGCQGVLIRNLQSISYHRSVWARMAAKRIPNIQRSSPDIDFPSDNLRKFVLVRKAQAQTAYHHNQIVSRYAL